MISFYLGYSTNLIQNAIEINNTMTCFVIVCISPTPVVDQQSCGGGSRVPEGRGLRVNLPEVVQLGGGVGGGTVLVVNLPPPTPQPTISPSPVTSATLRSTYSHTYIEVS